MKKLIAFFLGLFFCLAGHSQEKTGQVDIFCGADLYYADTNASRLYDVLVNLTPGFKVNMGRDWTLATQLSFQAINDGYHYRKGDFQLSMMAVSKEWTFGADQHVKATGGLFSKERYGVDVRWMMPITSWLMVQARVGLTNKWYLSFGEQLFEEKHWVPTGTVGANVWIDRWATEFRISGGRYFNEDWGVEGDAYCHFKHVSVGMFAQYHEKYHSIYTSSKYNYSGGFRVVFMLPFQQKGEQRDVVKFRPASNFRLTYNAQSDGFSMKKYHTDPEENEREYQTKVKWGTGLYR